MKHKKNQESFCTGIRKEYPKKLFFLVRKFQRSVFFEKKIFLLIFLKAMPFQKIFLNTPILCFIFSPLNFLQIFFLLSREFEFIVLKFFWVTSDLKPSHDFSIDFKGKWAEKYWMRNSKIYLRFVEVQNIIFWDEQCSKRFQSRKISGLNFHRTIKNWSFKNFPGIKQKKFEDKEMKKKEK